MSKTIIKDHPEEIVRVGAEIVRKAAGYAVAHRGRFTMALSGGTTPRPMHRLLAEDPYRSDIPWRHTHIFWVDERLVPADHPDSNLGLARKDLLDHVPLPAANIHPMPTENTPAQGALEYRRQLGEFFKPAPGRLPALDLICLGVGSDGHVASLFPGPPADDAGDAWVISVRGGSPDIGRLTLTFPVLNSAGQLFFLVSGKNKAAIVKTILEEPSAGLPAQHVQPYSRNLIWLLDRAAASLLTERKPSENREQ
ncbi:MAG: 6-phosphogluconolactonase [Thermodesulfobacteriota bacterium]